MLFFKDTLIFSNFSVGTVPPPRTNTVKTTIIRVVVWITFSAVVGMWSVNENANAPLSPKSFKIDQFLDLIRLYLSSEATIYLNTKALFAVWLEFCDQVDVADLQATTVERYSPLVKWTLLIYSMRWRAIHIPWIWWMECHEHLTESKIKTLNRTELQRDNWRAWSKVKMARPR